MTLIISLVVSSAPLDTLFLQRFLNEISMYGKILSCALNVICSILISNEIRFLSNKL